MQYQTVGTAKIYIIRFITLIVALQLLNLSIYAQDFKPMASDDGTCGVNISETVVEYVVEVVLGHKDAIPEQTQHDKDLHFHKHVSFKAINLGAFRLPEITPLASLRAIPLEMTYDYMFNQEINPPPPKAAC